MVVNVHVYFHLVLLTYLPHSPQVRVTRSAGVAVRTKRKAQYHAQVIVCMIPPPNYPPNHPPNRRAGSK